MTSSIIGAFFGALSADWLNTRREDQRREDEQLSFLMHMILSMASLVGKLYLMKQTFVLPRVEEVKRIESERKEREGVSRMIFVCRHNMVV